MKGWPLYIVVFFIILFIVDGIFIYTAFRTQDAVVPSYTGTQDR